MIHQAELYQELRARGGVFHLSGRTILFLTGDDRVRYLNGQVTSNVSALPANPTQPACVTTAKGRLCAEIMISALADSLVVDADPVLRESLPPRLERYIVADDVQLYDGSDEWRLLHFLPPTSPILPNSPIPSEMTSLNARPASRFRRQGFDILASTEDAKRIMASLAEAHAVIDETMAETLRIEAGIPRWGHELDENTLPPEAGLDHTHIDYHKGCYIGQEVISRLSSVGHVNRQLTGFVAETGCRARGRPAGLREPSRRLQSECSPARPTVLPWKSQSRSAISSAVRPRAH